MTPRALLESRRAAPRPRASSRSSSAFLVGPQFFRGDNLELIARQTAIVCMAALGMTMVIVAGGIDLSVGSIVALTTVVIALLLASRLRPGWPRLRRASAPARSAASSTALLVTRLRVVPFIVTLGTMLLVRGAAKGLADERRHRSADDLAERPAAHARARARLPRARRHLARRRCWRSSSRSRCSTRGSAGTCSRSDRTSGRRGCAAWPSIARRSPSTPSPRALAGVAGVLQFSRLSVGDPTVAVGLELDVIAAVIIGGGSLVGRPRHRGRHDARRRDHGGHPDRLLAARAAQLGAADRDRRDHRARRGARSVARSVELRMPSLKHAITTEPLTARNRRELLYARRNAIVAVLSRRAERPSRGTFRPWFGIT